MATKVKFTSPFGTAQYPHISSPDTKGKYADNKFKTKLTLPLGDPQAQDFIKQIEAAATELGKDGKKDYRPYVEDEDANTVTFTFKSQYQPGTFDSKGGAIPSSTRIGGGSVLRVMGVFMPYGEGTKAGITAQINQVQVKTLNGPGVCAFDDVEDGYVADGDDTGTETDDGSAGDTPNAKLDI
jgi:hypothetical protein